LSYGDALGTAILHATADVSMLRTDALLPRVRRRTARLTKPPSSRKRRGCDDGCSSASRHRFGRPSGWPLRPGRGPAARLCGPSGPVPPRFSGISRSIFACVRV